MIRLSIRTRIIFLLLIQIGLILGISGYLLLWQTRNILEGELDQKLRTFAQILAHQIEGEELLFLTPGQEGSRTYRNLRTRLQGFRQSSEVRRAFILDINHRSLCDTEPEVSIGQRYFELYLDRPELERVWQGEAVSSVLFRGRDGQLYKRGYAPVFFGKQVVGAVAVEGSAATLNSINKIRKTFLTLGGLFLVLSGLLGSWFARSLTVPLRRLEREAHHLAQGRYDRSIAPRGRDEIGFLARTMEEMRRSIVRRDIQQKAMLAGVAHEIRNPLGGIELYAGILANELADKETRSHALKILKEVRNLREIIDHFLEFARPSPPQRSPCSIRKVLTEVADLLGRELQTARVSLQARLQPDGLQAFVDAGHLKQILLNLIKNAAQAMPGGGTVSIRGREQNGWVVMHIQDEGPGIPPEHRDKIFEPFFSTKEKGLGLGLALVKNLVEENKGRIELVESSKGAHFKLSLPKF